MTITITIVGYFRRWGEYRGSRYDNYTLYFVKDNKSTPHTYEGSQVFVAGSVVGTEKVPFSIMLCGVPLIGASYELSFNEFGTPIKMVSKA